MAIPCEKVGPGYFDSTRWCFSAHEIVTATPRRVFDVFEDAPSWPRWAAPITNVEWSSPFPLAVGSTRTVTMVGDLVGYEEFIEWDPPDAVADGTGTRSVMAFRFNEVSKPGVSAFAEHYNVFGLDGGRSLVEWRMAMTPDGPGARVFALTAPLLAAGVRHMLGRFARYVNSEPVLATRPSVQESVSVK